MKAPKFRLGDKIEIVGYGSLQMEHKNSMCSFFCGSYPIIKRGKDYFMYDSQPDLVGQKALVRKIEDCQGQWIYTLEGVNKTAWYDECQLKMINPNPNTI